MLKDYKEKFTQIMPNQGLFVLNHNDVHRLNFLSLEQNNKLMLIDHEYAAMNLIGVDIVNYLIEANFNYKVNVFPFFENKEKIDFSKMYDVYLKFLDKFEEANKRKIEDLEINKIHYQQCRTFEYFLKIVCLISLFWFVYSIIYLDFSQLELKNTFDHFSHALARLSYFDKAYSILVNCNTTNI